MYDLSFLNNGLSLMLPSERIMLYALIFGLKPQHYLEVGSGFGGSAQIVRKAMTASGYDGQIICVDAKPFQIAQDVWTSIGPNALMISGQSPEAVTRAGHYGPYDFVLIDADHRAEHVLRDIDAVLPLLADDAYVLFHDSHYDGVKITVDTFCALVGGFAHDAGTLTKDSARDPKTGETWGGLRLVRCHRHKSK